ncbi:unnamed protein product [Adineta ricciae]|uniref:G-protein coupled receptors family 1 profile domain-containing protein n=1 Tax=Adineta ricciae TaxID=249248 RepID=A0A815AC39_ADIRI|nr:unnamed protein product [Adineta ricciae]CAF1254829.1 unnamed protein product [Adineta ricciae]
MNGLQIITVVNVIILLIGILLTLVYVLSIILLRRFHTAINILTGNFGLSSIICGSYWMIYNPLTTFHGNILQGSTVSYVVISYLTLMVNCLPVYALVNIAVNRYFTVIYPNRAFFKKQMWILTSILTQWIVAIILPMPHLILSYQVTIDINQDDNHQLMFRSYLSVLFQTFVNGLRLPSWILFYNLSVVLIFPSIIIVFFDSLIFYSVRSSTLRVHALPSSAATVANVNHGRNRDVNLVKHMLFIFVMFIIGWGPIYIYSAVVNMEGIDARVIILLQILPVLDLSINIIDLFIYNRDLRRYLIERCLNFLRVNRN